MQSDYETRNFAERLMPGYICVKADRNGERLWTFPVEIQIITLEP